MAMGNNTMFPPAYLAADASTPLLATSISFLVLETLFMGFLYTSRYFAHGERSDLSMEVLMTLTYVVCVSKIVVAILMIKIGGAGHHLPTLPPSTITNALKLTTALQIICPLTTSLSKLGVLCLFARIFAKASKLYRHIIHGTFVLVLVIMIAQVLTPFLNCRPFSHTWNPMGPGTCAIPGLALWRYIGIPNVLTTLLIVGIPVPALVKLQVSRSLKLGLVAVFGVCVLGIVAAIMRFQSFLQVHDFNDITYENVKPLCWTIAESGIYLVAGVMLTLRPLLRKVFAGTLFERLVTGTERTMKEDNTKKRGVCRLPQTGVLDVYDTEREKMSFSDIGSDGGTVRKMKSPKAHDDGGWI